MANVGILVVGLQANYSALERDLGRSQGLIKKFAKDNSTNKVMANAVTGGDNFRSIDAAGSRLKALFRNVGAGPFAELADNIGDAAGAMGAFGVVGGLATVGVVAGIGLVVAGFKGIQSIAASAMKAVDAAFNAGSTSKTLEALNKIIDAGGSAGITITLADTQKVQAINDAFRELSNAMLALGVQFVSEFQPEILAVVEGMKDVVRTFSEAAKIAREFATWVQKDKLRSGGVKFAANAALPGVGGMIADWILKDSKKFKEPVLAGFQNDDAISKTSKSNAAAAYTAPAALEAGTAAQYSASRQAIMAQAQDPALTEAKKQTEELRRSNEILERIGRIMSGESTEGALVGI